MAPKWVIKLLSVVTAVNFWGSSSAQLRNWLKSHQWQPRSCFWISSSSISSLSPSLRHQSVHWNAQGLGFVSFCAGAALFMRQHIPIYHSKQRPADAHCQVSSNPLPCSELFPAGKFWNWSYLNSWVLWLGEGLALALKIQQEGSVLKNQSEEGSGDFQDCSEHIFALK